MSPSLAVGSSPAPALAGVTATIGMPALGLSMRLPGGWVGLDATVPASIIDGTAARFPDLATSFARLRAGELGFVAYDAASIAPPTANLTIATTGDAIPSAALLDAVARQTADQLARSQTLTNVEHQAATLSAGPAAELRYRTTAKGSGLSIAVDAWFVATANRTFVLTYTVPAAQADAMRAVIRTSADSLSGG